MRLIATAFLSLLLSACSGGDSSAVGTFTPDVDAMAKMAVEESKGQVKIEQAKEMMASMKMELVTKADHTYSVSMTMPMGMGTSKSEGTWKLEGDKLHFTETASDGKKKDKPETKTATYAGGVITMEEGGRKITMKKK